MFKDLFIPVVLLVTVFLAAFLGIRAGQNDQIEKCKTRISAIYGNMLTGNELKNISLFICDPDSLPDINPKVKV